MNMINTVFDTNVLVSAFMNKDGIPAKVLYLFVKRDFSLQETKSIIQMNLLY